MNARPFGVLLALAAGIAGCSGSPISLVPHAGSGASAPTVRPSGVSGTAAPTGTATPAGAQSPTARPSGATPSPSPTPKPGSSGQLTPDQAAAALEGVETYYQTLPHTDPVADIDAVVAHMTSSGAFASATAGPGGITATLPDGETALVFADRLEDLTGSQTASARNRGVRRAQGLCVVTDGPCGAAPVTAHEIAFFVNMVDHAAFTPQRQADFANAFGALGFPQAGYGIDERGINLEDIDAIGTSRPLDFLDVATHGMVAVDTNSGGYYYANLSTSPVNAAEKAAYAADFSAGRIAYAIYLAFQGPATLPSFAFTPDFLTTHLAFNPGAIVDNQSCFGQSSLIATAVQTKLQLAGAGRYLGWTKAVGATDADQTDAFLLDRTLGEASPSITTLDQYATQRTPPQRPFPLDDVETALASENRDGPLGTIGEPYTVSNPGDPLNNKFPPVADGTIARFVVSDFGGESVANPPIVYALPTIERLAVTEVGEGGVLEIDGTFPAAKGSVTITLPSGTATSAPIGSWTANKILAAIPNQGAVLVQVVGDGIASNVVPLTEWAGTLAYTESDKLTSLSGSSASGSGTGMLALNFNVAVRSDVHPTVVTIETTPAPQNLYFSGVERGDSVGTPGDSSGGFTSGASTATFQRPGDAATMLPTSDYTFDLKPAQSAPAPCNDASPGPSGAAGNVYCPALAFDDGIATTCGAAGPTDICLKFNTTADGGFGGPFGGLVQLAMDPTSYSISVTGGSIPITPSAFGGGSGTATLSGTFGSPVNPPSAMSPAFRQR